jgi:hypothetical protein
MSRGFESRRVSTESDGVQLGSPQSSPNRSTARKVLGNAASMSDSATPGTGSQGQGPESDRSNADRANNGAGRNREEHLQWVLQQVRQALTGLKFGQITITVQDGLAIQIERTEKTRLR